MYISKETWKPCVASKSHLAVGDGDRDIVNYCGFIKRRIILFKCGNWTGTVLKYGEVMWGKVKIVYYFQYFYYIRSHCLFM